MNVINQNDVLLTFAILVGLLMLLIGGFAFEFAGELLPGDHTISWWAHRDKHIRWFILGGIATLAVVLIVGLAYHFAGNHIGR